METTQNNKNLENRARRIARRAGLRATKSRQRKHVPNGDNFGGFMLLDARKNFVVAGSRFDLSAEDVIEFCSRP